MRTASPLRRLAIAAGLLIAVLVACGREITGPVEGPVSVFQRIAPFAFEPKYETAIPADALHAALVQVAFERVRITLRREDGSIALDTVVSFPVGSDSLVLSLTVSLPASAPASGVPLSLNLGYVNAAGDTVFKGGPVPVTVTPGTGGAPPAPVQVPVHYTGPGASAASVTISPKSFSGNVGQSAIFTAQALSASGQAVPGTPIVFSSSNPAVVTVNATSGSATLVARGTAKVYAQLLNGPSDSASISVSLPAAQLVLMSGETQTAPAGASLPQPVVARVRAADGVGVGGVTVTFAASSGGSATPASAVSDASGNVSTQWKLGPAAGSQTLTVTAAGLSGSPLAVSATAQAVLPTRLAIVTGPVSGKAAVALPSVTVAAQDAGGNVVTTFAGNVTVALGNNPGGAALSGTTTTTAVNGIATFSDLKVNKQGTGYTLAFSSADLAGATSAGFAIAAGDAATLVFGAVPAAVDAGLTITPAIVVRVQDAAGNDVTSFASAVTVGLGANPGSASLSGTLTRSAVSGGVTFDDLSLNKRGVGYTLVASASGLASGTSARFTVSAGLPKAISIVAGAGQKAVRGSLLQPISLKVSDAYGNGVGGVSIALALGTPPVMAAVDPAEGSSLAPQLAQVGAGGSLSATSITTDTSGSATFRWTLGDSVGTQLVTASIASPSLVVSISATALAGAAANLAVSTQPASAQTAGVAITPSIVVQARDSMNALQASFTGAVVASIASGPSGATLGGTTTVSAVSGAATFGTLRLTKAGTYQLQFSSAGITPAVTTSFVVAPAPAKSMLADSGNAQSGAGGVALPQKLVVLVADSVGNPVSGRSVTWAVTAGGGSLDSTSTTTDAQGRARVRLTLGGVTGTNTVTATSTGLTGSPVTFTATATVGTATQLAFNRQPRASSTAGAIDTVIVHVKDAGGNMVTGSTATVTLGIASGPAGASVIGTVAVAAVNGVATFDPVTFDKMGAYTLTALSSGLSSATSTSFSITAGWPEYVVVDSGGAQTGSAGQPLPNLIVARLTDLYGNTVVGRTINWAVTTGGGSLANTTTVSDTGGRVRAQWNLGLTAGAQSATATAADTGLTTGVATFTATASAVAFNKLWTGTVDGSWGTAGNWSPSGVPAATDSVKIGVGSNYPTLTGATTVAGLTMDPSTSLSLDTNTLTVNGSINVPATGFAGSAGSKVILGGATGSTIVGAYGTDVQFSGGTYGMTGGVTVNGSVSITAGRLDVTMHGFTVSGDFSTSGTGILKQSTAMVSVAGNVSFGGTGVSTLTGGDLAVAGDFTAASTAVVSMVLPHNVKFNGTSPQTITLTPGSNTPFANVELSGAGAKTLATGSQMAINGTAFVLAGSGLFTGTARTVLRGVGIIDSTAGSWNVDSIYIAVGTVTKLPPTLPAKLVQIVTGGLQLTSNVSLPNANVFVYGGTLDINGQTLSIGKNFSTASAGLLRMMSDTGSLTITGNAFFNGADESGQLTAGTLVINGNFTQGTNPAAFKAGPAHVTRLTGTANQSVSFAHPDLQYTPGCVNSCFGQLLSSKTAGVVTFLSDVKADSSMLVTGMDTLKAAGRTLHARGDFSSNGRADGAVFAKYLRYAGGITRTGGLFSVDTLVAFGPAPTLMAFETLPLVVKGTATLPARIYSTVIVDSTAGTLQTSGKDTVGTLITRNGGRLQMVNAVDSLFVQKDATFGGGATTGLLTAGTLVIGGNLQVTGAALDASGTHTTVLRSDTARVLSADPQGGVYGFQNLVFGGSAAKDVLVSGGWAINVKGMMLALPSSGRIGSDTALSQVWVKSGGAVIDSTAADTAFKFARLMVDGVTALPPRLAVGDLMITGSQLLYDSLLTTGSVTVNGGLLDLNGHKVRMIGANRPFLTSSGGRLKMMNPADSLWADNGNDIYFAGGSTDGLLTDGRIIASGSFQAGGAGAAFKAFAATANHWVVLLGSGSRRLKMLNAGFTSSHFAKLVDDLVDTLYLKSNVVAESFVTGAQPNHFVRADTGAAPLFTVKGASISSAVFDGVRLALLDGVAVTALTNMSFINQDPAAPQLTISRSGTGTTGSIPALGGTWAFATTPTTGKYLVAVDTDGASPDTLNVNFSGTVSPAVHGGKIILSGGATTNWAAVVTFSAVSSGNWNNTATWSPAGIPGALDDVTIGASLSVSLTAPAAVRNITLAPTASLMLGYDNLSVYGNWTADTATSIAYMSGKVAHYNSTNVTGRLGPATFFGPTTVTGATIAPNGLTVKSGSFNVNGQLVTVTGPLSVDSLGTLRMESAGGLLVINGDASFTGASTNALLTDGTLRVSGNFTQAGDPAAFSATGSHRTVIAPPGFSGRRILFADPGKTTSTSHFAVLEVADSVQGTQFWSDVYAVTKLETTGTGTPGIILWRGTNYTPFAAPTLWAANVNSARSVFFSRVMLHIYDANASTAFSNAIFTSFTLSPGEIHLRLSTNSASPTTINISALDFQTLLANTTGYVEVNNLGTGSVAVNFNSMMQYYTTLGGDGGGKFTRTGSPLPTIAYTPP